MPVGENLLMDDSLPILPDTQQSSPSRQCWHRGGVCRLTTLRLQPLPFNVAVSDLFTRGAQIIA